MSSPSAERVSDSPRDCAKSRLIESSVMLLEAAKAMLISTRTTPKSIAAARGVVRKVEPESHWRIK